MDNNTAWGIFAWSLLVVGIINFDSWKSIVIFIFALIIFLFSYPKEKSIRNTKERGR